jgi:hypothetical protein
MDQPIEDLLLNYKRAKLDSLRHDVLIAGSTLTAQGINENDFFKLNSDERKTFDLVNFEKLKESMDKFMGPLTYAFNSITLEGVVIYADDRGLKAIPLENLGYMPVALKGPGKPLQYIRVLRENWNKAKEIYAA